MTEPNPAYGNGVTPVVVLAGRAWPVPPLTIAQLRHVVPAVTKSMPQLANLVAARGDATRMDAVLRTFDERVYGAMLDVIYWGLKRAHPALTREEFDGMEAEGHEIGEAFSTVVSQSRMYKKQPEGREEPGELATSPIGTA